VPASTFPFAGELISVAEQHPPGAARQSECSLRLRRRLVRDGTSCRRTSGSRLADTGVRLVIEAVLHAVDEPRRPKDARSLVHRLAVSDGPFASYVRKRMASEFDYACVSHLDELDDVERGVTIGGLVKRNSRRYEKDDRHEAGDATRWVLGGDTHARLEALLERRRDAMAAMEEASARDAEADSFRQDAVSRRDVFTRVSTFSWDQVDLASAMAVTAAQRRSPGAHQRIGDSPRSTGGRGASDPATGRNEREARTGARSPRCRPQSSSIAAHVAELEATPCTVEERIADALEGRFRAERRSVSLETVDEVARKVQSALSKEKDASASRAADAEASFAGRAAEFRLGGPLHPQS
jgi:uncharacterized protein YPO0396